MIIIISSAKTMNLKSIEKEYKPNFEVITNKITEDFLNGNLTNKSYRAIDLYNGMVFKNLNRDIWDEEDYEYASNKLFILSALYGVVKANDGIKPYRLDFTKNGSKLYKQWNEVSDYLASIDSEILNLASNEFSSMLDFSKFKRVVDVEFYENKNSTLSKHSTISKKGRGLLSGWIIKNKINDFEKLKEFNLLGYKFIKDLSDDNKLVFVR